MRGIREVDFLIWMEKGYSEIGLSTPSQEKITGGLDLGMEIRSSLSEGNTKGRVVRVCGFTGVTTVHRSRASR